MEGGELYEHVRRRLSYAGGLANLLGALDLFFFAALLTPISPNHVDRGHAILLNAIVFVPYMAITLYVGRRLSIRRSSALKVWLVAGRDPTPAERDLALRTPAYIAGISAKFWFGALLLFVPLNLTLDPTIALTVGVITILGGITTSAVDYLLAERILRPVTARALAGGLPERPVGPGTGGRVTIAWVAATGMPLLGIVATAVAGLVSDGISRELLAAAVIFLALLALGVGLFATLMTARSLAEPMSNVRKALGEIEQGNLDVSVPVDDGSEIGLVEAGFNQMAAGLREREQLRDLFGRHVGRDVALAALADGVKLGGELRIIGALFVDVIGSTALASRLRPERVVALLNDFFAIVVDATESHGGHVNKFEGDGALCVFGAPSPRDDPAGDALAAARELHARLVEAGVDAGIGVSAGPAVAGNVGSEARFEYTVIGDPVNEAARLCELAKRRPERLAASDAAIERANPLEAARWTLGEATVLRGRAAPTRIATAT